MCLIIVKVLDQLNKIVVRTNKTISSSSSCEIKLPISLFHFYHFQNRISIRGKVFRCGTTSRPVHDYQSVDTFKIIELPI